MIPPLQQIGTQTFQRNTTGNSLLLQLKVTLDHYRQRERCIFRLMLKFSMIKRGMLAYRLRDDIDTNKKESAYDKRKISFIISAFKSRFRMTRKLFFLVIEETMAIALVIGVSDLAAKFEAHTFVFLCSLKAAGAVSACFL